MTSMMKSCLLLSIAGCVSSILAGCGGGGTGLAGNPPSVPAVANSGFESPALAANDWNQALVPGWSGRNAWGFANGSGQWGAGGHSGSQYAFVRTSTGGAGAGEITQTVDGFTVGAKYKVSFWLRKRTGGDIVFAVDPNKGTPMRVYANGALILGPTPVPGDTWVQYTSKPFVATATNYAIKFVPQLVGFGDWTDLIDDVEIKIATP